jgi:hydrogenase 3 maturation protease
MDYHRREEFPVNTEPSTDWKQVVAAELEGTARVAVCGIGNELRGNDAAGVLCLRKLKNHPAKKVAAGPGGGRQVVFIECGESPENQTGRIRKFQPDLVLLLDAARGGRPPGDIFIVDPHRIADDEVSTHRISLGILVRFIEESIGARVLFLGLEPGETGIGTPVSEAVKASVSALSDYLSLIL